MCVCGAGKLPGAAGGGGGPVRAHRLQGHNSESGPQAWPWLMG